MAKAAEYPDVASTPPAWWELRSGDVVRPLIWSPSELASVERIRIEPLEVVYAYVGLGGSPAESELALLDADEQRRSERFVHERDRRRFILAHAALRALLARCIGSSPDAIRYTVGPEGKPALAGGGIEFNMAHSHELGLVAVTRRRAVGVDVERVRQITDALAVARSYFSARERALLRRSPPEDLSARFLELWTRKEAVIKARGDGLARALDSFDVDTVPRSLRLDSSGPERSEWAVRDLEAPEGFVAAGAVAATADEPAWREL